MGNKLTEYISGFYEKRKKRLKDNKQIYDIYYQFDDDEPILAISDIPVYENIIFEVGPEPDRNMLVFEDKKTGKKIKIFIKYGE